jgi:hypothetical protein
MKEQPSSMRWAVLIVSAALLTLTVITSFFKHVNTASAYWLFGSVAALVFGASIYNSFR